MLLEVTPAWRSDVPLTPMLVSSPLRLHSQRQITKCEIYPSSWESQQPGDKVEVICLQPALSRRPVHRAWVAAQDAGLNMSFL